ncbi:MAG TPA: DUF6691 family protein [bacterium]|nr:DUF6691 family protein [bacterium]
MALKRAVRKTTKRKVSIAKPKEKSMAKKQTQPESALPYLVFGTLFGYFLSKARATDYDSIVDMFLCREFQLYGVILTAIAVVALGLFIIRRKGIKTKSGAPLELETMDWEPSRLTGAFLFGAGWALTGTCPGTSLAQIGEGKLVAFFTVAGILAGVWAYKKYKPASSSNEEQVC